MLELESRVYPVKLKLCLGLFSLDTIPYTEIAKATLKKYSFPRTSSPKVVNLIGNINENYCGLEIMINVTSILYHHNF